MKEFTFDVTYKVTVNVMAPSKEAAIDLVMGQGVLIADHFTLTPCAVEESKAEEDDV